MKEIFKKSSLKSIILISKIYFAIISTLIFIDNIWTFFQYKLINENANSSLNVCSKFVDCSCEGLCSHINISLDPIYSKSLKYILLFITPILLFILAGILIHNYYLKKEIKNKRKNNLSIIINFIAISGLLMLTISTVQLYKYRNSKEERITVIDYNNCMNKCSQYRKDHQTKIIEYPLKNLSYQYIGSYTICLVLGIVTFIIKRRN